LAGVLVYSAKHGHLRCRHRIVADYYFNQCISKHGSSELILNILRFLSRQFTVADIRNHPLPYRIYKEIVSFEFLYERYFADGSRLNSTEAVYHESQSMFGTDGIFWLHFGRFYRKTGRLDEAIECFRTGLSYFESYQTRHQLGVALLERYMEHGSSNREDYEEGIETLERERATRGTSDAFPVGTMIDNLRKIIRLDPRNEDAAIRLRECLNFAMRHFKDDPFIRDQVAAHFGRDS
jgi:tetratricopeptide (TPR) repeat protein